MTNEQLEDLKSRINMAIEEIGKLAIEEDNDLLARRLLGKREGLALVLDYLRAYE